MSDASNSSPKTRNLPRSRQARSQLTDRRLMDATLSLMREGGLGACTAPEIARRAGVAVGTIYRRFADKDELVGAAILDVVSLHDGEQAPGYRSVASDAADVRDFLKRYILAAIRISRDEARFLEAVREHVRSVTDPGWLDTYRAQVGRGRLVAAQSAIDRFPVLRGRELDLSIALASIHGAINGCLVDASSGFTIAPGETDGLVEGLVRMAGDFLEPGRAPAQRGSTTSI